MFGGLLGATFIVLIFSMVIHDISYFWNWLFGVLALALFAAYYFIKHFCISTVVQATKVVANDIASLPPPDPKNQDSTNWVRQNKW